MKLIFESRETALSEMSFEKKYFLRNFLIAEYRIWLKQGISLRNLKDFYDDFIRFSGANWSLGGSRFGDLGRSILLRQKLIVHLKPRINNLNHYCLFKLTY